MGTFRPRVYGQLAAHTARAVRLTHCPCCACPSSDVSLSPLLRHAAVLHMRTLIATVLLARI